jgi:hypothetical protein
MTRQIPGIILSLVFYGFVAPAGADTVRMGSGILDSTAPVGGTTGVQINRVFPRRHRQHLGSAERLSILMLTLSRSRQMQPRRFFLLLGGNGAGVLGGIFEFIQSSEYCNELCWGSRFEPTAWASILSGDRSSGADPGRGFF